MRALTALGVLMGLGGGFSLGSAAVHPRGPLKPNPRKRMGGPPLAEECPTCGAPPGQPCNPLTLGRHPFHMARVKAVG
jgi:hypothetical protein